MYTYLNSSGAFDLIFNFEFSQMLSFDGIKLCSAVAGTGRMVVVCAVTVQSEGGCKVMLFLGLIKNRAVNS